MEELKYSKANSSGKQLLRKIVINYYSQFPRGGGVPHPGRPPGSTGRQEEGKELWVMVFIVVSSSRDR